MKPTERQAYKRIMAGGTLLIAAQAMAQQEAVMTTPENAVVAPALRDPGAVSQSTPATLAGAFFTFGALSLHPHLVVRSVYGLGLPTEGGRHVASMINTQAPGLTVDAGRHWTIDYTPTWTTYTARALKDTVDHSASLQGTGKVQDWAVTWTEIYNASSPILIETGAQTAQRTWSSQLGASRGFSSGLTFSTNESLNERYAEISPDTRDWATMNWLTVRSAKRLEAGLGLGAGYSEIVGRPDGTNERYMGRLNWSPTDKLSIGVDGGMEARHSRASGSKDMRNPLLNGSLIYRPFLTTTLSVTAAKFVTNSYFDNQVSKGTSWNVTAQQRLLRHLYFSASYSRQRTEFESVTTFVPVLVIPEDPSTDPTVERLPISLPGRSDHTDSFNARLTTTLLKRLTLGVSCSRSRNRSSQTGFTFTTTQYGLELAYRY